jgi:hypothetical protein
MSGEKSLSASPAKLAPAPYRHRRTAWLAVLALWRHREKRHSHELRLVRVSALNVGTFIAMGALVGKHRNEDLWNG